MPWLAMGIRTRMTFERMDRTPLTFLAIAAALGALAVSTSGCNGCGFSVENSCVSEATCAPNRGMLDASVYDAPNDATDSTMSDSLAEAMPGEMDETAPDGFN